MATINDKAFIDNIIQHNGFLNGDDEVAPDNHRCIKIVEYTNDWGRQAWGIIFENEQDKDRYRPSQYVINPKTIWEYKQ